MKNLSTALTSLLLVNALASTSLAQDAPDDEVLAPTEYVEEAANTLHNVTAELNRLTTTHGVLADFYNVGSAEAQYATIEASARTLLPFISDAGREIEGARARLADVGDALERQMAEYRREAQAQSDRTVTEERACQVGQRELRRALDSGELEPYSDEAVAALTELNRHCQHAMEARQLADTYHNAENSLDDVNMAEMRQNLADAAVTLDGRRQELARIINVGRAQVATSTTVDAFRDAQRQFVDDTQGVTDALEDIEDQVRQIQTDIDIDIPDFQRLSFEDLMGPSHS